MAREFPAVRGIARSQSPWHDALPLLPSRIGRDRRLSGGLPDNLPGFPQRGHCGRRLRPECGPRASAACRLAPSPRRPRNRICGPLAPARLRLRRDSPVFASNLHTSRAQAPRRHPRRPVVHHFAGAILRRQGGHSPSLSATCRSVTRAALPRSGRRSTATDHGRGCC